jgi:mono/diheme cytochrome c family protein
MHTQDHNRIRTSVLRLATLAGLLASTPLLHAADTPYSAPQPLVSEGRRFAEKDGESLYKAICQGCHMADGKGAQGAGAYPALAGNPNLASPLYPAVLVLKGRRAMPPFRAMLSDEQITEVSNYVRSHLGNNFPGSLTAAEVKALR